MRNICIMATALLLLAACAAPTPRYRIGVSQCSDDEWRDKMNHEMRREMQIHPDASLEIRTSHDNSEQQVKDIRHFIEKGVDLIIVSPNEAERVTPVIDEAFDRGIRVVVFDRRTTSPKYTAWIGADNYEIGLEAGRYIAGRMQGQGTLLEVQGLRGSSAAYERHKGFIDGIKGSPGIRLLPPVEGNWLRDTAEKNTAARVQTGQHIDYIFAHNDRMALGAYDALKSHTPLPHIVGVDGMSVEEADTTHTLYYGVDLVDKGILESTFLYPTSGDRVIRLAMDILQGKTYKRENNLETALIDASNARLMLLQTRHITELDNTISTLNGRLDRFLTQYSQNKIILHTIIIILVLLTIILLLVVRGYWTRRKLNAALADDKMELEERVEQLLLLGRQYEEAASAKLVFYTNVSHDFRTPLTLIIDPIEQLMGADNLTGEQETLLRIVHRNVAILSRLVNQILDFRKYENGKLDVTLSPTPICQDILEWSEGFRSLAYRKQIRLTVSTPGEGIPTCMLDTEKTERIYFNLLSNAFKHTPAGGEINVALTLDTASQLRLSVRDTGEGMAAEQLDNIFERFYQIDHNHTGSGIGLALVKAFCEVQKGGITVQSTEGKGSEFTVTLPFTPSTETDIQTETRISVERVVEELSTTSETTENKADSQWTHSDEPTVLIIDDNSDIRQYIHSMTGSEYTILEATNGQEGLRLAMQRVPDIIVCDVMMPVMDGLECCKRLKAEMQTSHIPVILLTACTLDEQRATGYDCGADSYLSKPFSAAVLTARIHNLLESRKRMTEVFGDKSLLNKADLAQQDKDFMSRFRTVIERHLENAELTVDDLAEKMSLSRVQLYRKVKALTDQSPTELLRTARLTRAASLLASTDKTVAEITYDVGFSTPSYFTK